MCIYCGNTNTTKEEVDKHIMCHTNKNQLGYEHCDKAFTKKHTQTFPYCDKLTTRSSAFRKHAIKKIHQDSI